MPKPIRFPKSSSSINNSDSSDIIEQTKSLSSRIKPQAGSSHIYSKDNSSHYRGYNKSNRITSINNNTAKKYGSKILKNNYKSNSNSHDNKISSNPLARALNADFSKPENHNNNKYNHVAGNKHKVPPKFSENALAKALSLGSNTKFTNVKQKVNGSALMQKDYKTNFNNSNNSISKKKQIDFNSSNAKTYTENTTSPRNISLNFKNAALPKFLLLQNLDPGTSADDVTVVLEANIGKVKFVKTKYDAQLKGISAEVIFSEPTDTIGANNRVASLNSVANDSGNNSNMVATNKVEALVNSAVQMFDGISSDGRKLMASSPSEPTVLSKKELLLISKTN